MTHGHAAVLRRAGTQAIRPEKAAGLLAIVDYADRWPGSHLAWLASRPEFHLDLPTRLLLVARSQTPWAATRAAFEELDADTSTQFLAPLQDGLDQPERERMFTVAWRCFARRYGHSEPATMPADLLTHPDFGLTLTVHIAALAAVDARIRGTEPPSDITTLSAYLLNREQGHWERLYENRMAGLEFASPPQAMRRAVFTAALCGTQSYTAGAALISRLNLEIHPDRLLADHGTCYPPARAGQVLEPPYPDRIAEDFVALSLPGHSVKGYPAAPWADAAVAILATRQPNGDPPEYATRMLQVLAAAARHDRWPHVARPPG